MWAENNRYYIDGNPISIANKTFLEVDIHSIVTKLEKAKNSNKYDFFNENISRFIMVNKDRFNYLKNEAIEFVKRAASKFDDEHIVISFSGGKDSTVTADIAVKALSNPSIVHVFGDTTLEFPTTIDQAHRVKKDHPKANLQIAKNAKQKF